VGLCQGRKTALRTLLVTFDMHTVAIGTLAVCLTDFYFCCSDHKAAQHKLWNDAFLRIASATVTALPITLIVLFLVSHFNFSFVPCGGLSWLPVIFTAR